MTITIEEVGQKDTKILYNELYAMHKDLLGVVFENGGVKPVLQLGSDEVENPKEMVKEEFESDSLTHKILDELENRILDKG